MKSYMKFNPEPVTVKGTLYMENGTSALLLLDANGVTVATATSNLEDQDVPDDVVWIKDYSENEGVLQTLIENDIVEAVGVSLIKHYDNHSVAFHQARIIDQDILDDLKAQRES
jgi:DNA helicase HerA-like ATPase